MSQKFPTTVFILNMRYISPHIILLLLGHRFHALLKVYCDTAPLKVQQASIYLKVYY